MINFEEIVHAELSGKAMDDVRKLFMQHFESEITDFERDVAIALAEWTKFDSTVGDSEQKAYVLIRDTSPI